MYDPFDDPYKEQEEDETDLMFPNADKEEIEEELSDNLDRIFDDRD